jgi:hypothetical protein
MLSYSQFVRFVKQVFSLTVRRTRLENLQLLQGRSCCLSRIARFFPLPTDYNHRLRRLWRFLTNPHFIPEQVYPQLIRALAPCWPAQLPMPPAGPRSARVGCRLSARLAGGGYQPQPPGHAFIAAVTSALRAVRPQMRLVWIADRGFARLSLFQFLAGLGVDFCIRVNAKTKIAWRGRNLLLSELAVKPGQTLWLEGVIYRPQGRPFERGGIRVNLLVAWKRPTHRGTPQAPQPWYVVTSLESPQQALASYRRRMRIEEGFRDWKQRLGLRQAAVSTVERMARLLVGLVLATLVLALLGVFGLPAGFHRAVLGRGKGSWLWLALQLVEQAKPPELLRALKHAALAGGLL